MSDSSTDSIKNFFNDIKDAKNNENTQLVFLILIPNLIILVFGFVMILINLKTRCMWFIYSSNLSRAVYDQCTDDIISDSSIFFILKLRIVISCIEYSALFTMLFAIYFENSSDKYFVRCELMFIVIIWYVTHVALDLFSIFLKFDNNLNKVNSYNVIEIIQILIFLCLFSIVFYYRYEIRTYRYYKSMNIKYFFKMPELIKFFVVYIYTSRDSEIKENTYLIKFYLKAKIIMFETNNLLVKLKNKNSNDYNNFKYNINTENDDDDLINAKSNRENHNIKSNNLSISSSSIINIRSNQIEHNNNCSINDLEYYEKFSTEISLLIKEFNTCIEILEYTDINLINIEFLSTNQVKIIEYLYQRDSRNSENSINSLQNLCITNENVSRTNEFLISSYKELFELFINRVSFLKKSIFSKFNRPNIDNMFTHMIQNKSDYFSSEYFDILMNYLPLDNYYEDYIESLKKIVHDMEENSIIKCKF